VEEIHQTQISQSEPEVSPVAFAPHKMTLAQGAERFCFRPESLVRTQDKSAVRFDAYTATTTVANHLQLADLFGADLIYKECKGLHQFRHRVSIHDEYGSVGQVLWGGAHGNRVMLEVKGERTPEVVERLRSRFSHRATRLDACADFDEPGAFDRLLRSCMAVKQRHRLKGERRGDWQDFPEQGRTQYLGSVASHCRLRVYEKGKQSEYRHVARPDWVRLEVQLRPTGDAREQFSKLTALEVWGATAWSRALAKEILAQHVDPHRAGTVYRLTSLDEKLMWMCRQYGTRLACLKEDLGSWECVGATIGEMIHKARNP
jgi:DNA relaxase NicK